MGANVLLHSRNSIPTSSFCRSSLSNILELYKPDGKNGHYLQSLNAVYTSASVDFRILLSYKLILFYLTTINIDHCGVT